MNPADLTDLSRTVSHALRHEPWLYELELDDEGWVAIDDLLDALHTETRWRHVTRGDIETMMANAAKQRHEIRGDRIRARYGHSVPGRISSQAATPPDVLYHGTAPGTLQDIERDGLLPMRRQYVHLSADLATARAVGARKAPAPVILRVDAARASADGVEFYPVNDQIWLTSCIDPSYITPSRGREEPDR